MIKPFSRFLATIALISTASCSPMEQTSAQDETTAKSRDSAVEQTSAQNEITAKSKKALVEESFQKWQDGAGSPFDLLSEDMRWTISGFNKYAGTYTREPFEEELIEPFNERLAEPLEPTQWKVYEDGDVVIINFDAETTLVNGEQYKNSYAWFFTFEGEEVTEILAFLDMPAFEKVLDGS